LDAALADLLFELFGGVAAVGPQFAWFDAALGECVQQGEQVAALVLVAGRDQDLQRCATRVDG
jgi:hypothetical protein